MSAKTCTPSDRVPKNSDQKMNTYTKEKKLKPIVLNKQVLLDIEEEITKPWKELKASVSKSIEEKISIHNREVKTKGYSFKLSTDNEVSKKIIPKEKIEEMSKDDKSIEKELVYPIRKPEISYKDNAMEMKCPNVIELYNHNLQHRFQKLIFTVYGNNSKVIELSFSSNIGLLNSVSNSNLLKVSSSDEAWTMLVIERIVGLIKRHESARSVFDNIWVKLFFFLILPILTVYAFSKALGVILPPTLIDGEFRLWLYILSYFLVFFFSIKMYDDLFEQIVLGSTLDDQLSNKNKVWYFTGISLTLGVVGTVIWDVIKHYFFPLK